MKIKLSVLALFIFQISYSQWSTKPYADSGLYVCPGFTPGIVTFNDGSSIVLGILSSYIYAQKLDSGGYKVWPSPVLIHHNDSSDMAIEGTFDRTWFCSDGNGGVILYWQDYRGAYYATDGPKNSTTYLQRVDRNGMVKWGTNGIKVNNLEDGYKTAQITSDGSGGCALLWTEYGFDYPGAPQRSNVKLSRYNSNGARQWYITLDSTIYSVPTPYDVIRAGKYYYISYANFLSDFEKSINENGDLSLLRNIAVTALSGSPDGENIFSNDYKSVQYTCKVSKIDFKADTLWTTMAYYGNKCTDAGGPLLPDNRGGTYIMYICQDSTMYFDSLGFFSYKGFTRISNHSNYFFSDGGNGLLAANATTVVRYDNTGRMVWPDSVVYLIDPGNAYSKYFSPDNNGGFIVTYWSTLGGIYAQHSGRNGKLGIVTNVKEVAGNTPNIYKLYQNYPNPFNGATQIKYSISMKSRVLLDVYDILGRKIKTLVDQVQDKGEYLLLIDLSNLTSGVYFYRLSTQGQNSLIYKMLLLK